MAFGVFNPRGILSVVSRQSSVVNDFDSSSLVVNTQSEVRKNFFGGISLAKLPRVFLMCLAAQMLSACAMLFNVSVDGVEPLPPLPILTSAPALRVASSFDAPTATFTSADPNHSYFECQVDGVFAWTTCTSPFDLTTVVDRGFEGTFRTRSVGIGGDVGSQTSQLFRRGIMPSGVGGGYVNAVAYQSDGKKLLGGDFTTSKPEHFSKLMAIHPSGQAQSLFQFVGGYVYALAVQGDGKILVGGMALGAPDGVLRFNPDGTKDTAFSANAGVGFNNRVDALVVQSDGKILVGGGFTSYAGNALAPDHLLRLNPDGTEDTAFSANAGVGFDSSVVALAVQSDGKILVGGWFVSYAGSALAPDRLLRLNPDGTEDTAFSLNAGVGFNNPVRALVMQSDGKILVGGDFTSYAGNAAVPGRLLRLNPDGTEDSTFSANAGVGLDYYVRSLVVQSDGKILVGGWFTSYAGSALAPDCLLRLNPDGTEDTAFSANAGDGLSAAGVHALAVQGDGKIFVGGEIFAFSNYGGTAAPDYILRLNPDDTDDTAFSANAGVGFDNTYDNTVSALALQSEGKILVGGDFTSYAGNAAAPDRILRLNSDGTEDTAFSLNAGVGFDSPVIALVVQSDRKILVGGNFASYAGSAVPGRLLRLNPDGTEDTAFSLSAGVGFNNTVRALALQSDGKILVGGNFTSYAGSALAPDRILRLNSDGTEDAAFSLNAGVGFNNTVSALAVQSDGKILVGGDFTSYAGNAAAPDRILRLNSDGTEDAAFSLSAGVGFDNTVRALAVQSDGKILVGGRFTGYGGAHSSNHTCELNSDGRFFR